MKWAGRSVALRGAAAAGLAVAAGLFTTTRGDVGTDGTWLLQVIARVHAGDALYRDVFFGATPLSVYLGHAATAVFGIELLTLRMLVVAVVVLSYLVAADLLARLVCSRRYDLVLAPMVFTWGLPANASLYQPLANLCLLAAVDATVAWAGRLSAGRTAPAAWLWVAGAAAGLAFSAKQTTGFLSLAAIGVIAFVAVSRCGRASSLARAWLAQGVSFCATAAALLVPVVRTGGWAMFLEYGFLNKGTYLRLAGVSFVDEVSAYIAMLPISGSRFDPLALVKGQPLLLPPLLVVSLVAAWRFRRRDPLTSAVVALLSAAEAAMLFPRPDLEHVVPAVPGMLVAILFAWHAFTTSHASGGESLEARAPRFTRAVAILFIVSVVAGSTVKLAASAVALTSPERVWSALPHLNGVLIPGWRERELAGEANAVSGAAVDGQLFLLLPNAGLYYLVSGVSNPTPFDYPLVTAFGRTGEHELSDAIARGRLGRLCMAQVTGSLAPRRLQEAVLGGLQPRANLGPCTLYSR